jgi:hypothetical protein
LKFAEFFEFKRANLNKAKKKIKMVIDKKAENPWIVMMEEDDDKVDFDYNFFGELEKDEEKPVDCSKGWTRETRICDCYFMNDEEEKRKEKGSPGKLKQIEPPAPSWLDENAERLKRKKVKYICVYYY